MATPKKSVKTRVTTLHSLEQKEVEFDALANIEFSERYKSAKAGQLGRFREAPEDDLGQRIQETRNAKKLTQGGLADLTKSLDSEEKGISRAVLSLYEAGKNRPSPREIRLLCEALSITPNYLIYGDDSPFHEGNDYQRYGVLHGSTPEACAYILYVLVSSHPNHSEAALRLLIDIARASDHKFDQGAQEKANALLIDMAEKLKTKASPRS